MSSPRFHPMITMGPQAAPNPGLAKRALIAAVVGALLALDAGALAQPVTMGNPKGVPQTPPVQDQEAESRRSEARGHFEKGLALFQKEAWDAALAEFTRSRAIYPTRAATRNEALCLHKLRRFDEALDTFEEMLRFPNLSAEDRAVADRALAEIRARVGTLRIDAAEPGASLVVDGRFRGIVPLSAPLRVAAGSHEVRAYKEGQDPFGATVEVKAGQQAVVSLRSLSTGGRLKVSEQRDRVLEVVVDGTVVGKTPWEGPLAVGEHLVTLRGTADLDAAPACAPRDAPASPGKRGSVELGTQPVSVPIRLREVTKLTLTAEELDTSLRVEPTPGGASVFIDSVAVGLGTWEGRLHVGTHTVEVTAPGFLPEVRRVTLERRKQQVLSIELRRDLSTPGVRTVRGVAAGTAYGVGALGLITFGVTGIVALEKIKGLKSRCPMNLCPPSEQGNLDSARAFETVSTVGFVLGAVGVATGTIVLLALRSGPPAGGVVVKTAVGPGRIEIGGIF